MQPSIEKLQKFFKLEADIGYSNRAVIGGFERLAPSWEAEARNDAIPEDLIMTISERLRNYGRLSPTSRQEALHGLWNRIQRTLGEPKTTLDTSPEQPPSEKATPQHTQPSTAEISPRSVAVQKTLPPRPALKPFKPSETPAALDAPVTSLIGIGPRTAQTLERLGIRFLRDMLYYFPRRYIDYTKLKPINRLLYGEQITVIGTVENVQTRAIKNGRQQITEALLSDGSGKLRLTWFNQPHLNQRLQRNPHISVSGKIDQYLGRLVLNNPEWEPITQQQLNTNRIVPVYSLTASITQTWLRRQMHQVVNFWAPHLIEPFPEAFLRQADLLDLPNAILQIHFPDSWDLLQAARHRLAFDEIFYLQLGVLGQKRRWESKVGRVFSPPDEWVLEQLQKIPFQLTHAQQNAIQDLRQDLAAGRPMNRLLQGDVGSGKTIVAALAMAMIAREEAQCALMAPTSILAEQHYRSLSRNLIEQLGVLNPGELRLLVGATSEQEKQEIRDGLRSGTIKVVIGTHALIEDPVEFSNLALVVIDEQHRFGVDQRSALRSKGNNPHLLVMTATPIPRSLALTVYGDLDLTVMDEMPAGRQEIKTFVLKPLQREQAYRLIRKQIKEGRQGFIIYPLVEESEKSEAMAAVEESDRLQNEIFPEFRIGLLHGRLKADEKDRVMGAFQNGEFDILVSTSVVEVGIDVPNATVMLIEGANRFGLAQLHQFRGRVGRGNHESYCLLIPENEDQIENERLAAMVQTNDGFKLAEIDLEQRGPGEFLGTRQSGFANLQMVNLTDVRLIEKARYHAQALFNQDPDLTAPQHQRIHQTLQERWSAMQPADIS
jgi:ATP-dependent DNA helicase RecG